MAAVPRQVEFLWRHKNNGAAYYPARYRLMQPGLWRTLSEGGWECVHPSGEDAFAFGAEDIFGPDGRRYDPQKRYAQMELRFGS